MTPSAWARGGAGVTIRWAVVNTTLGPMLVAATDEGRVPAVVRRRARGPRRAVFPNAELVEGGEDFADCSSGWSTAVEQPGTAHDIPLDVQGTAFQQAGVARTAQDPGRRDPLLCRDRRGRGQSEGGARGGLGQRREPRRGADPAATRVIRTDGSLGGYAYGLDIKRELLERERR